MADHKHDEAIHITLDKGMTLEDCDFLESVYLPCELDMDLLDLDSLSPEEIQEFFIAFKVLDGKNIYNIVSLRNNEHYLPPYFMILQEFIAITNSACENEKIIIIGC